MCKRKYSTLAGFSTHVKVDEFYGIMKQNAVIYVETFRRMWERYCNASFIFKEI